MQTIPTHNSLPENIPRVDGRLLLNWLALLSASWIDTAVVQDTIFIFILFLRTSEALYKWSVTISIIILE